MIDLTKHGSCRLCILAEIFLSNSTLAFSTAFETVALQCSAVTWNVTSPKIGFFVWPYPSLLSYSITQLQRHFWVDFFPTHLKSSSPRYFYIAPPCHLFTYIFIIRAIDQTSGTTLQDSIQFLKWWWWSWWWWWWRQQHSQHLLSSYVVLGTILSIYYMKHTTSLHPQQPSDIDTVSCIRDEKAKAQRYQMTCKRPCAYTWWCQDLSPASGTQVPVWWVTLHCPLSLPLPCQSALPASNASLADSGHQCCQISTEQYMLFLDWNHWSWEVGQVSQT